MTKEQVEPCYHCGEDCGPAPIRLDEKLFCCSGCKTVYEILSQGDACDYYRFEEHPGFKASGKEIGTKYAWLDQEEIRRELTEYSEGGISRVRLFIPSIHCSSCIWLLENLRKLNSGVLHSMVNFTRKEVVITFREQEISLRQLVELLVSVNYIPQISLDSLNKATRGKVNRGVLYRLGVAGFCFGNIMLFSFPAYLSVNDTVENLLRQNFGILNILFGIPAAFYSGSVYFVSAWKGLKNKFISIDLPIATGILVLFCRSFYEITSGTGHGFMDSLAGLVFFLSIGRWYQDLTYQALSFDRDYKSYFPVAVTVILDDGNETVVPLRHLKTGMRMMIRNQELIPADSLLVKGEGMIDYSFVSGESSPIPKSAGERVFAGGRQTGATIELIVEKEVAQSRLTELWNQDMDGTEKITRWDSLMDVISRYFTAAIILISLASGIYWYLISPSMAFLVVTSVLIVACPCALAMTIPFTFGGTMRFFGKNNFYLKRTAVVETMASTDTIVFDKTGTITTTNSLETDISNLAADEEQFSAILSVVRHSTHPSSQAIAGKLANFPVREISGFREIPAKGVEGYVNGNLIRAGSESFITNTESKTPVPGKIYISFNDKFLGYAVIKNQYRAGMSEVLLKLAGKYELHLLSGDNDAELPVLRNYFPSVEHLNFNQTPQDKLHYINNLKKNGKRVLMVGDGLNDAGALRESDCGISIADDVYHFSPACDAILESGQFHRLPDFLAFTKRSMKIVYLSIGFSFLYNLVGLSYAISGKLSPVVSAILMPLSSVSVVAFVSLTVFLTARFYHLSLKR